MLPWILVGVEGLFLLLIAIRAHMKCRIPRVEAHYDLSETLLTHCPTCLSIDLRTHPNNRQVICCNRCATEFIRGITGDLEAAWSPEDALDIEPIIDFSFSPLDDLNELLDEIMKQADSTAESVHPDPVAPTRQKRLIVDDDI